MIELRFKLTLAFISACLALVGPVSLSAALASGTYAAPSAAKSIAFKSCVVSVQGTSQHYLTLIEAKRCGGDLPVITRSKVASTQHLPTLFIVADGARAALEGTTIATAPDFIGGAYACNNTYTNPWPWWWVAIDWGSINTTGYGDQCGYANMTGITPSFGCSIPCTGSNVTSGTADSVWNNAHYQINSALGWGNFNFSFVGGWDFWACRAFVDTNGNQSPSSYCS